tara:strand:+ start:1665 stop:1892 length:228 start_codon:yes stop_codon:yes gene_type:complete
MNQTSELLTQIDNKYQQISEYKNSIQVLNNEIKTIKKKLYVTCQHIWITDSAEAFDSLCKKKCKICKLYRNNNCN